MEDNKPLYRYYIEDGELKHLSTTNYKYCSGYYFIKVPAEELGIKSGVNIRYEGLNTLTGKHNVFTFDLDDKKVKCLFENRIKEIQLNIINELKIIETLIIK